MENIEACRILSAAGASSERISDRGMWAKLFTVGVLAICFVQRIDAAEGEQGAVFSVVEENDFIVRTDRHYTQGLKFSFLHREGFMPAWLGMVSNALPEVGYTAETGRFGYELGQTIYTPYTTSAAALLEDERPYAGWLYGSLLMQKQGEINRFMRVVENWQVDLGVIGPESMAEETQRFFHDLRGNDSPHGWENQLETEPGIALKYARAMVLTHRLDGPRYFDLIPHAGASLGNVETALRAGAALRAGWNLPRDTGVQTITAYLPNGGGWRAQDGNPWTAYVYSALEGRAIAHTVFLDGNLFRESPQVDKEVFVSEWRSGIVIGFNKLEIGFAHVYRTREYEDQKGRDRYASILLKYKF